MDEGSSSSSKRRRGLGFITKNACVECRKKRAKCDGKTPACTRCESAAVPCQYETSVRQSKDSMRNDLHQLQTYRQQSHIIFQSLIEGDKADDILERLKSGEAVESIAIRLTASMQADGQLKIMPGQQTFDPFLAVFGQSAPAPSATIRPKEDERSGLQHSFSDGMRFEWETPHYESSERSSVSRAGSSVGQVSENTTLPQANVDADLPIIGNWMPYPERADGVSQRDRGQEFLFGPDSMTVPDEPQSFNTSTWTTITDDTDLMDHLLALYFSWEYPTFASISKENFLKDYRSGSQRFCSSLLVNSLLALGSRFTDGIEVRGDALDGRTAGDVFYTEALRLLNLGRTYTLPTIQALGLLSIREASCGLDSDSWFHSGQSIRMACEMGLHRVRLENENGIATDLEEVQSATFWGAFSLNTCWSMMTGRLPHYSHDIVFMFKPSVRHQVESIDWVPYTDDGMPLERNCTQTSNIRTIYKCFCELSEILHHSLYIIYSPGNNLTAPRLVGIYTTFLNWYGAMPEALRLGRNFTPAVLFVHMYYHTVVLHLFRPFIKTRLTGSTASPRDICINASENISNLVKSYSQLYTLRRTPSLVPYIVLSSTLTFIIIQIPHDPDSASFNEKLIQGITDLRQMNNCHGFARIALEILRFLTKKWNIAGLEETWKEEDSEEKEEDSEGKEDVEEKESAEERKVKGIVFSSSSMNFFCPDIEACNEGLGDMSSKSSLFSIFHMTGLPLVAQGKGFSEAGFEMLIKDVEDMKNQVGGKVQK